MNGVACDALTASADLFTRAPRGYSMAEAATVTTAGVTAWRALTVNGPLKAGETVLVQGSGGVSLHALQIAKALGARVVATSSSADKLARLRALGADHVINYRDEPEWGRLAHERTGGRGVGGHIAMIGILGGTEAAIPMIPVFAKQIRLQGCLNGSWQDQTDLVEFLAKHDIRPIIDRSFRLEDLAEAFGTRNPAPISARSSSRSERSSPKTVASRGRVPVGPCLRRPGAADRHGHAGIDWWATVGGLPCRPAAINGADGGHLPFRFLTSPGPS